MCLQMKLWKLVQRLVSAVHLTRRLSKRSWMSCLDPKVASQIRVFAGDIVAHKKPDPAIYYLAAQELGVEPSRLSFTDDPLP